MVRNPRPWSSGVAFPNTSLLSEVYGCNEIQNMKYKSKLQQRSAVSTSSRCANSSDHKSGSKVAMSFQWKHKCVLQTLSFSATLPSQPKHLITIHEEEKITITDCVLWLTVATAIPTKPFIRYHCQCTFKYDPDWPVLKSAAQARGLMQNKNSCITSIFEHFLRKVWIFLVSQILDKMMKPR